MVELEPTQLDQVHLLRAIELGKRCPPSRTAFSVGALIVCRDGATLATGYSREQDPHEHAEEAALAKLCVDEPVRLADATLYSSLEPCSTRASRSRSCVDLILATPVRRVVFAWREPDVFVEGQGAELLRAGGCQVIEVTRLAHLVRRTNAHILGR